MKERRRSEIVLTQLPNTITVTTEALAYGPHAVARHEGKVVFVRGAAPEETVEITIVDEHRTHAFAVVQCIIEPSALRRAAPCPYLPDCGGCPWQHVQYAAQLEAKTRLVRDHLRRIGGLDVDVRPAIASPLEFAYRHRLKLRVEDRRVGYYAGGSHRLVPVHRCLIGDEAANHALPAVATLVRQLNARVRRIEIAVADGAGGVVVHGEVEGDLGDGDAQRCERFVAGNPEVRGLVLSGKRWRQVWGEERIETRPEAELILSVRAGSFTQVNPRANHLLVRTVLEFLGTAKRVLDLFAGAGNFSLPLARRGIEVVGVESDWRAAADGEQAARRLGLSNCRFIAQPVQRVLRDLANRKESFDAVILDPPRSGAADAIPQILRLGAPRVVYVSCDPTTLARDLRVLVRRYRINAVQPIDMFPHTYHVETVVCATSSCEIGTR